VPDPARRAVEQRRCLTSGASELAASLGAVRWARRAAPSAGQGRRGLGACGRVLRGCRSLAARSLGSAGRLAARASGRRGRARGSARGGVAMAPVGGQSVRRARRGRACPMARRRRPGDGGERESVRPMQGGPAAVQGCPGVVGEAAGAGGSCRPGREEPPGGGNGSGGGGCCGR
jgi:hypothetical protein